MNGKFFNLVKPKSNYFILLILLLILTAMLVSYYRYFITLDYDIYMHISCDPKLEVCVTNGDIFYKKVLAKAFNLNEYCSTNEESCVLNLIKNNNARVVLCEENISKINDESCTNPNDYQN